MRSKILKGFLMVRGRDIDWLANELGMSQNTLYLKLSGKTQFKYDEMVKIRQTLDLNADEFLSIFPNLIGDE